MSRCQATIRYEQLLKLRATQSHPYANFGTGNAATLSGGDAAARRALLAFHEAHYAAPQMSLALVHPSLRPRRSRRPPPGARALSQPARADASGKRRTATRSAAS